MLFQSSPEACWLDDYPEFEEMDIQENAAVASMV
jgi:hypothetical protein